MDEQEFFNKIKELQKQRDLLKKDVTVLECKINELRDILELKNIKKGYYTNNLGLFCKVYDIKGDNIHVYELDTTDLLSLTKETYYWRSFEETYYKKCTKEPVWIVSWGDGSWWEVNRVPDFYKNQFKKLEDDTKADMEG